jgi:hypothetical protein
MKNKTQNVLGKNCKMKCTHTTWEEAKKNMNFFMGEITKGKK